MIKTILMFAYIGFCVLFLFPFGLTAVIFYFLGLRKLMTHAIYRIVQGWALLTIKLTGTNITVTGTENIPKKGGVCFVSNHCGYFDIALLLAYCGRPFGFIAKKELLIIPFFNAWIYMLGGLFMDRKSLRKAVNTINIGVKKIQKGGCMVIFPEGTRSKGRGLLPFHAGSLKLATLSKSVIVPVAIQGSYDVFEKTGRLCKANTKITFCQQIDTAVLKPEEKKQVLSDRIYNIIKEHLT